MIAEYDRAAVVNEKEVANEDQGESMRFQLVRHFEHHEIIGLRRSALNGWRLRAHCWNTTNAKHQKNKHCGFWEDTPNVD